jgi:hypothetical protein
MNHKLDTDTQVFFYEQDFYVFSNFASFKLFWNGISFYTSEVAYHYEKFRGLPAIQDIIVAQASSHDSFKAAIELKEHVRSDWMDVRVDIMRDLLRAKTAQHEYVKRKLLATGDRELIEDSWRDDFWGWGEDGLGQNMLGKLWMEVREETRLEK